MPLSPSPGWQHRKSLEALVYGKSLPAFAAVIDARKSCVLRVAQAPVVAPVPKFRNRCRGGGGTRTRTNSLAVGGCQRVGGPPVPGRAPGGDFTSVGAKITPSSVADVQTI